MNHSVDCDLKNISIENTARAKISRFIYDFSHFNSIPLYSNSESYCLIRIYEFDSKTVVIASQLKGAILWDEHLIAEVIENIEIVNQTLYWINHIGFFSSGYLVESAFFHTTFSYTKEFIFSRKEIKLEEEIDIDVEEVEELIESSLEPVEHWLGLDLVSKNNFIREKEEKTFTLLHNYIETNIQYFLEQKEVAKAVYQSQPGAIFFYPKQNKKLEFLRHHEILDNNILTYIDKSFPDRQIVICVFIDSYEPFCTICSKESFINPARVDFVSIEELVENAMKSTEILPFNYSQHLKEIRAREERLQSLLRLNLEPKLNYLKSQIEKYKSYYPPESEFLHGALFYYPEHNYCTFDFKQQLTSSHQKIAASYINSYNPETEVVICFSIYDKLSVCGVFPK